MPRQRLDLVVEFPGMDALRETMKVLEGWRWIEMLQIRRESIFEDRHDLASVFRVINTRVLRPRKWETSITVAWCIDCLRIILTMSAVKSLIPRVFNFLSNREVGSKGENSEGIHGENGFLGVDVFRNKFLMLCIYGLVLDILRTTVRCVVGSEKREYPGPPSPK